MSTRSQQNSTAGTNRGESGKNQLEDSVQSLGTLREWKRHIEIGVLKDDYIRLLTATTPEERLAASRPLANAKARLTPADRRFAERMARHEVVSAQIGELMV